MQKLYKMEGFGRKMDVKEERNGILLTEMTHFSLFDTLECGQCFRWEAMADGAYRGIARGKILTLREIGGGQIRLEGVTAQEYHAIWEEYFDLRREYGAIREQLSGLDPILATAGAESPGIRILRQEPWEALCSFIISANNNIPRIKEIIRRLCREFGEKLGEELYSFPSAEVLAGQTVETLAPLRCGFRAKYILDAAKKVAGGELNLEEIAALPLPEARAQLPSIYGVGDKVAECVLLFGMGRLDAFPLDVWMKRAMRTLFPGKTAEFFGEYAGLANQYIFFYARNHRLNDAGEFAGDKL